MAEVITFVIRYDCTLLSFYSEFQFAPLSVTGPQRVLVKPKVDSEKSYVTGKPFLICAKSDLHKLTSVVVFHDLLL